MEVELFSFSKRINSTKIPSGEGVKVNCTLKNPTSMHTPSLILASVNANQFNYARFNGEYYFISDCVSVNNNVWEITLSFDPMGTCRNEIMDTTAFCLYSTAGSTDVVDNRAVITENVVTGLSHAELPYFTDRGLFVLSVQSNIASGSTGFSSSFVMDLSSINQLNNAITTDDGFFDYFSTKLEIFKDKASITFDPWNFVISCIYLPIASGFSTSGASINLGGWDTGVGAQLLTSRVIKFVVNLPLPFGFTGNDWQHSSAVSKLQVYLPYVGLISLNVADLYGESALLVLCSIDAPTGEMSYIIRKATNVNAILGSYSGNCGVKCPLSAYGNDYGKNAGGVIAALTGIVTANPVLAVGGVLTAVGGTETTSMLSGGLSGASTAGLDNFSNNIVAVYTRKLCREGATSPAQVHGLPDGVTRRLGSISGYVQTLDASVAAAQPNSVLSQVNGMLNGGAYIE